MNAVINVLKRELSAYFNAAIAYIFIIVFVLLSTSLFMTHFFVIGFADMRPFFTLLPFILAVFMPAVTMRMWAEEKRGNTLELLLTFPMQTHSIVAGKFLASFIFYAAALAGTLTIPVMLKMLGNPDPGVIAGGYLGTLLLGAFFLAIGIFISGFCHDQIVAFILAMITCFGLHLTGTEFIASSVDSWVPGLGTFLQRFIGSAQHYDSFAKGVVDAKDFLYFILGTVIFLSLNGFWLEGRMKPGAKKIFTLATVVSLGIFLTGNWFLSDMSLGRFDLTQGKMYTISDATKKILSNLKVPVTAKYYVSPMDKMPTGMKTIEQEVVDKLEELRIASSGNFQYKVFHMEAANVTEPHEQEDTMEQELERKGIQPFQVRAIVSDEVAVRLVYSTLTLAYKEKAEEILPRIIPDNLHELEYRIISKVYRMNLSELPKVALVAPYEEKQMDPQMAALLAQLGGKAPSGYKEDNYELLELALQYEGYPVSRIKLTEKEPIPEGIKTLIVAEPSNLNERQRYEINKFVHAGGSLFLAVQNYNYNYDISGRSLRITPDKKNPQVNELLGEWGLEVDDYILVDEQHDVISLSGGAKLGPFDISVPVKVPIQVLVTNTGMNPNISITSRLSPIFYLWGTAVKILDIKKHQLKAETLFSSSENSLTIPPKQEPLTPDDFRRQPESRVGPFPLAVMVEGQFPDAFLGRSAPSWPKEPSETPENSEPATVSSPASSQPLSAAPGKVILVGASSFLQKTLFKSGGHMNFFINAVDALSLGDELITIRSKQPIDRTIKRVSAASKIGWRFLVSFLVPILIAGVGAFRMILRRRAKQNYLKSLAVV